jgi:cbb3-type cytochrome oxidase subunit 3
MSIAQWLEHYSVVLMTVVFIGIVAATYWPGRKSSIEKQGRIPFEDDV